MLGVWEDNKVLKGRCLHDRFLGCDLFRNFLRISFFTRISRSVNYVNIFKIRDRVDVLPSRSLNRSQKYELLFCFPILLFSNILV